jgi:FlaA1/EpsC-like NDP-sugar epimerase
VFRFKNFLFNNISTQQWFVFFFDTIIGATAVLLATYFVSLAGLPTGQMAIGFQVLIVTLTYAIFFYFFRTAKLIPNNKDFKSALRTLDALSGSFIALMLLNLLLKMAGRPPLVTNLVLIISTLISVLLIGGYRFVAALFSRQSGHHGESLMTVALYGSKANISEIKNSLEKSTGQQYRITAVFLDRKAHAGSSVNGIEVFSFDQLVDIINKRTFDLLLFTDSHLDHEEKNRVVDICLDNNIGIKEVPEFKEWINGHLTVVQLKDISIEGLYGRNEYVEHSNHVLKLIASKRILITGAAGSIGSELARQVAAVKHVQLILCDQNESGLYQLEYELKTSHPKSGKPVVYIGNVRDETSMDNLFKRYQPQVVFHAAAYKHVPMMEAYPSEATRNNVYATRVLADLAMKYQVERFLFVSTDKAINPTNVMGASKRIAEMYLQSVSAGNDKKKPATKFIITRFGNVLGSNGSVIPRFKEQIAAGGPVTVTHPEIIRYFMTISEACALVLEAVTMGNGGEVFRFDMGDPVKIADLANKMIRLAGYQPGTDIKITYSGLRPGEKLFEGNAK